MTTTRLKRFMLGCCAVALSGSLVTGAGVSTPAQAAAGDVTITGHGYGHGRGLSQWGSYGYATTYGWNHHQILSHYYSNASIGNIGSPLITVRLTALDNMPIQVTSQANFTVGGWTLGPGTAALITYNSNGTWQLTTRYGCNGAYSSSVTISSPLANTVADPGDDITKMLTVCETNRTYRGAVSLVMDGGASRVVNILYMQDYLRGVVPRESPASWGSAAGGAGLNALMAQTVAARSYAWAENRSSYAKTCDTTACQVYGGAGVNGSRIEDWRTDAAVGNTGGEVMMLAGQVARTEFSSSSGGYTAGGTFPAVRDDGDSAASPYANWSVSVAGSSIAGAYNVGTFRSVTVLARNGLGADGGRVTKVRISGTSRSVDVSGNDFRSALGLKSDWFSVGGAPPAPQPPPWPRDVSPSAVAAVRTAVDNVIAFVRGTDGSLYYTTSTNGAFGSFQQLPASTRSGPAAVTTDGGHTIDVFVVGSDYAVWHSWTNVDGSGRATGFSPWQSLGGAITTAPSAASSAYGALVVSGRGTDGKLYSRVRNGGPLTAWQPAGGSALSAPAMEVVDAATYRARVVGGDGVVWSRDISATTGLPTTEWASTGRPSAFGPGVSGTTWSAQGVRAVATSNGPGIRQVWADGRVIDIGGSVTSSVALVEFGATGVWTFARGSDGGLWVNMVTDPAAPSTWYLVGGQLA
jgi:SpoIID/LytB domain protein